MEISYSTRDLAEAAFLYASNQKLLRLEQDADSRRCLFVFENKQHCEELINKYWQKEATVVAKDYADSLQSLKTLIFSRGR